MRKTVLLLAAAFLAASAGSANAIPPPVKTGIGGCDAGYTSVANVGSTHVCVVTLSPDAFVSSAHCPSGYTEVGSAVAGQWVCVDL
jgi:hypothetical protein